MDRRNFLKTTPAAVAVAVASTGLTTKTKELKAEEIQFEELKTAPGQCEVIRLWKLGSMEHGIYPTEQSVAKLAEILSSNKGGIFDIIWGPELTCEVITTEGKTVVDVIDIGRPTPEAIADKAIELIDSYAENELCSDMTEKEIKQLTHSLIVQAIKEAAKEAIDAKNA